MHNLTGWREASQSVLLVIVFGLATDKSNVERVYEAWEKVVKLRNWGDTSTYAVCMCRTPKMHADSDRQLLLVMPMGKISREKGVQWSLQSFRGATRVKDYQYSFHVFSFPYHFFSPFHHLLLHHTAKHCLLSSIAIVSNPSWQQRSDPSRV